MKHLLSLFVLLILTACNGGGSTAENSNNNGGNNNSVIHGGSIPNVLIDPQTSPDLIGSFHLVKTIDTSGNVDISEEGEELIRTFDANGDTDSIIGLDKFLNSNLKLAMTEEYSLNNNNLIINSKEYNNPITYLVQELTANTLTVSLNGFTYYYEKLNDSYAAQSPVESISFSQLKGKWIQTRFSSYFGSHFIAPLDGLDKEINFVDYRTFDYLNGIIFNMNIKSNIIALRVAYDDLEDINHLIVVRYDGQHMVLYDEASGLYDEYRRI